MCYPNLGKLERTGIAACVYRVLYTVCPSPDVTLIMRPDIEHAHLCVKAIYQLVCVARDDHSPQQLTATVKITVRVDDVNDHSPMFIRPQSISTSNATGRSDVTVLISDRARPGDLITAVRTIVSSLIYLISVCCCVVYIAVNPIQQKLYRRIFRIN